MYLIEYNIKCVDQSTIDNLKSINLETGNLTYNIAILLHIFWTKAVQRNALTKIDQKTSNLIYKLS